MAVWKPTPSEAAYLYGKLEGYQSSYGNVADVTIAIRILGEFKSHFSGTQRVPPIEYILSMVEEYKATHPHFATHNNHGNAASFGPPHLTQFAHVPATQTGIDYNFYQNYNQGPCQQPVNPTSQVNDSLGMDLHPGNYSDFLGMNMQFPNATAQGRLQQFPNAMAGDEVQQFSNVGVLNQVQQFSNTAMDNEAQQFSDATVDDEAQDEDPTTDLDSTSVDGDGPDPRLVEHGGNTTATSVVKSGSKRKTHRNIFYGRKTTGLLLYAQQNEQINRCVEERIKNTPELRGARVKVLAEERGKAWNELPKGDQDKWTAQAAQQNNKCPDLGSVSQQLKTLLSKLSPLQADAYGAFSFPMASLNIGTQDHPSFTDWLGTTYGPNIQATFMGRLDEFAKSAHKGASVCAPEDQDVISSTVGPSTVKVNIKDKGLLGKFWRGNLSLVPDPSKLKASDLRHVFRVALFERWKACGYEGRQIPWGRIKGIPANFIQPELINEGVEILVPEDYNIDILREMVQRLFDHQNSKVPYEKGLIFLPCGSGTELYYPTKRGKGKARAGTTKAVSPPPDTSSRIDAADSPTAILTAAFPDVPTSNSPSTTEFVASNTTPATSSNASTSNDANHLSDGANIAIASVTNTTPFGTTTAASTHGMASWPSVLAINPTSSMDGATESSPANADPSDSHITHPEASVTGIGTTTPASESGVEQQPQDPAAGVVGMNTTELEPPPPSDYQHAPTNVITATSPVYTPGNDSGALVDDGGLVPPKKGRLRQKKMTNAPSKVSTPHEQPVRTRLPRTATLKRSAEQAALEESATLEPTRATKTPRNT